MPRTQPALLWFRQDLRLADNPALHAAADSGAPVFAVFIHDDEAAAQWQPGPASRWWLQESLARLGESLGDQLHVYHGDAREIIPALVHDLGAGAAYWNRCVEPWYATRDGDIKQVLQAQDVRVHTFNGSYLYDPSVVKKKDGTPYRVFTPYYRNGCLKLAPSPRMPLPAPVEFEHCERLPRIGQQDAPLPSEHRGFMNERRAWQPGERGAQQALSSFIDNNIARYVDARDRPDLEGTSYLSPHLHFGEISPQQVRSRIMLHDDGEPLSATADKFLSELAWREFSAYQLYHQPELPTRNLQRKYDRFPWEPNDELRRAWEQGKTGFPIVDAGMRELACSGYMHNRVRMIAASFLVKNLLQDWRCGARWFWDHLVDAYLANNSASWQWVAGSGADAAPFFRIFNPVLQGRKFDPDGTYVRRYVPELRDLPARFVHCPWEAPAAILDGAGVRLGESYPAPIVDLAASRKKALAAYAAL